MILTQRSLVRRASQSEGARNQLVLRYQKAIKAYLQELLLREKDARDVATAATLAEGIFDHLVGRLANLTPKDWRLKQQERFRLRMKQWVHEAHWDYLKRQHPPPPADRDKDWNGGIAKDILRKT